MTTASPVSPRPSLSAAPPSIRAGLLPRVTTRLRYVTGGGLAILLALIALLQAVNAYRTTDDLFRSIIEVNSRTVDASERALQFIAQTSQAAADYALLTSDTPLFEEAQNDIFRDFSAYRDELAILRANLQSGDEQAAFTVAETFTYSRFWRHVSALVAQRSNDAVARREYLDADNHVRNWITPALQELETQNFDQMVEAGEQAAGRIIQQMIGFAIPALALVLLLAYISFVLRGKIRRWLTPGIDAALVLSIIFLLAVLLQLASAPGYLNTMIQNAYLSISASSRALVDANLANRAESSALLDVERAEAWQGRYDAAARLVSLRFCGQVGCLEYPITTDGRNLAPGVIERAEGIKSLDSEAIGGITPLVANASFEGELAALDAARTAFLDFQTAHAALDSLIDAGEIEGAVLANSTVEEGTSQEAFNRFEDALNQVISINRDVFDEIGRSQRAGLQSNQALFGTIGYLLIAILVGIGIWHRAREL